MEQKTNPLICMGLARLMGSVLFLGISIPLFLYLIDRWHLDIKYLMDIQTIGWPAYKAMLIAGAAGLVGLFIGQGIGGAIKIYNDDVADRINIYWHYIVNGAMIWMLFANVMLVFALGFNKEAIKAFYMGAGENFPYWSFLYGAIAGFLVSLMMGVFGRRMNRTFNPISASFLFWNKIFPYGIVLVGALVQLTLYNLPLYLSLFYAFIIPHILIPLSKQMWRKDSAMRGLIY